MTDAKFFCQIHNIDESSLDLNSFHGQALQTINIRPTSPKFRPNFKVRIHTPQPEQNSRLFPGFFQALKIFSRPFALNMNSKRCTNQTKFLPIK